jgi:hypothetical protein
MSVVAELFDKAGDLILRLWDRGQYFFWAVASVGTAILAVLSAGWWFGLGNAPDLFRAYGFPALILALCGAVFGIWRKLEDRSKPSLSLIPDEAQSFWAQSRQQDGRVTTQFCFRMQATNLTDEPVKLSALKLIRPRIKRGVNELARHVMTRHHADNVYGFEFAITPKSISKTSCDIILDKPVGKPGATITAVVAVSDQRGRWHKVKFQKLR